MSFQILVVDDTKFMRKMLTDILKQYGHEVVGEAENGRQAVQKYEELQPDIVLMDITMPEMDGIEAMKEIRKLNPSAVVLICSAMSQQDLISDALKAGANGYVMKPFKPNRVNEIVRKYGVPRVIGHLIPQDMQRTEAAAVEIEAVEATVFIEEMELQAKLAEGATVPTASLHAVDQGYAEPKELHLTKQDEEILIEISSSSESNQSNQEIVSKLIYEEEQIPEVVELQQSSGEPEPVTETEPESQKNYVTEEKKVAAKPAQVVNALEVLLAFAEVEESKVALETSDHMHMDETPEHSQSTEEEDRLLEMERLAAVMQGDLEQEWQLEQQQVLQQMQQVEASVIAYEDSSITVNNPIAEQEVEAIVEDIDSSSMELSIDDLNEITLEMESLESSYEVKDLVNEVPVFKEEVPVSTSSKSQEVADVNKVGFKAVNGGKIINLFRGNGPMKNFTSSVMCNWSEDLNGEMSQYLVVCTEAENKIEIDMTTASGQKQSITVTIESFNQLAAWLQVQLGTAPVSNREYAKKADF
ncbi:response regulator [Paenibacillus sp. LMG 31461]|uniref:Response regulator n=1 Tax=Paenibacillus plantarum TaxID=2654975 RepID=A0ABX1X3G8_9BACL|nr:response regulator [Paenibacillus plantarum]